MVDDVVPFFFKVLLEGGKSRSCVNVKPPEDRLASLLETLNPGLYSTQEAIQNSSLITCICLHLLLNKLEIIMNYFRSFFFFENSNLIRELATCTPDTHTRKDWKKGRNFFLHDRTTIARISKFFESFLLLLIMYTAILLENHPAIEKRPKTPHTMHRTSFH